jgi:Arc/MetJ family transcription regulator
MRTNIVLDNELVAKAMRLSGLSTKKEVVNEALKEYVSSRSRLDLRDLKGKISFNEGYDYKQQRTSKIGETQ